MWSIITAVVVGAIIGAVARLVLPGRQTISTLVTVILGILGALIGSWLVTNIGDYSNSNGGWEFIPFLAGVVVAALLIVGYGMATGKKQV